MSKIKPEDLQKEVMDYLSNYAEDIEDDVQETTKTIIKEAKEELIKTSPKDIRNNRKDKYYKGWAIKKGTRIKDHRYTEVVWNKTNYQLTHLLEFGHATKWGGRTKAYSHIRPVEEKYGLKFADALKQKIRRDSK